MKKLYIGTVPKKRAKLLISKDKKMAEDQRCLCLF